MAYNMWEPSGRARIFVRSLLAELYLQGRREIRATPFELTYGVDMMGEYLEAMLPKKIYNDISDIFCKLPGREVCVYFWETIIQYQWEWAEKIPGGKGFVIDFGSQELAKEYRDCGRVWKCGFHPDEIAMAAEIFYSSVQYAKTF